MKLYEVLYETINPNVTFTYHEDVEGDKNRGWRVDRIDAHLPGVEKPVGYLKISYIPKERWEAHFPTMLNFLAKMQGQSVLPYRSESRDYHDIPPEELKTNIQHAAIALSDRYPSMEEFKRLENLPLDQVVPEFEKFEKYAKKKFALQYRRYKQYYVDKPIVDFIRVEEPYQRQGIGIALHRAGHEWMKKRGLPYYASGSQTAEAKAVWQKMEKEFPIKYEKFWMPGPVQRKRFAD